MYCKKCGNEIMENTKYCPNCGEVVENEQEATGKNNDEVIENYSVGKNSIFKKKLLLFPMSETIIYGLTISIFISCLLPYASLSVYGLSKSIKYISGDGVIVSVIMLINCFFAKFKYYKTSMILSILPCIIVIFDFVNSSNVTDVMVSFSIGAYLCLILSIALACFGIYVFIESKKIK